MLEIEITELGQFGIMPRSSVVTRDSRWLRQVEDRILDPKVPRSMTLTHIFTWSPSHSNTHAGKFATIFLYFI